MQLCTGTSGSKLLPNVATIGFFDGVHRGHRFLIEQVCKVAAERGLASSVITFPVHPRKVMQPDFSDDDPMSSYFLIPIGLRLFPEKQKPTLLWMLNYLSGPDTWTNDAEQLFYTIFLLLHPLM